MKKYKLTSETVTIDGRTLYRTRALRDFSNVKKGDLGGFVEHDENLSHSGDCWVYGEAVVYGNAIITDNARVGGNARVFKNARVFDDAIVVENAWVFDNSYIGGKANICGGVSVYNKARFYDGTITD